MSESFITADEIYAPRTERFTAVISRRQKTKSGKPRFYLYSMDNQNLILCAEYYFNTFINFRISQSTTSFEPETENYLGKIEHSDLSSKYIIFKQKGSEEKVKVAETSFDVNRVKFNTNSEHDRQMNISLFLNGEEPKPLEKHSFSEIKEIYPDLEIIHSKQNIYFKSEGKHCLSVSQIHDDEFLLDIDAPLSIYIGFACALTAMVKVRGE